MIITSTAARLIRSRVRVLPRATRSLTSSEENWRKQQLEKLEQKFHESSEGEKQATLRTLVIPAEEDLQPMWRGLESRVKNRRSYTAAERAGKVGRANVRRTDEDVWLEEGLYDTAESSADSEKELD